MCPTVSRQRSRKLEGSTQVWKKEATVITPATNDIFVDAPAFIGEFKVLEFQAAGANHRLVFSKTRHIDDCAQVEADVKEIVEAAVAIFGKAP